MRLSAPPKEFVPEFCGVRRVKSLIRPRTVGSVASVSRLTAVAAPVEDYLAGHTTDLVGYEHALARTVLGENGASAALLEIFQAAPEPFVWLMQHSDRFWRGACDLIRGDTTYEGLSYTLGPPMHALLGPTAALARLVNLRRHPRR